MYILKAITNKSRLVNFWQIGKFLVKFFLSGGPNFKNFEIKLSQHNFSDKMGFVSRFESQRRKSLDFVAYSVFKFLFWPEEFFSSCNAPSKNSHKFWAQPPKIMKFFKKCLYAYVKSQKVLSVCMFAPWVVQICITPWNRVNRWLFCCIQT